MDMRTHQTGVSSANLKGSKGLKGQRANFNSTGPVITQIQTKLKYDKVVGEGNNTHTSDQNFHQTG